MSRIWFRSPQWYWFGWQALLPVYIGGDEYGRRTVLLGWTVTGRMLVAVSRPGRLYRPQDWQHHDLLTDTLLRASVYRAGGGVRRHGIQLTVVRTERPDVPVVVARIPADEARSLADLIAASRSLVWHDPRDADDPFWNEQGE